MQTARRKTYKQIGMLEFTCWFKGHGSTYCVKAAMSLCLLLLLLLVFACPGSGDWAEWRRKAIRPGAKSTLSCMHKAVHWSLVANTAPQPGHNRPRLYRKSLSFTTSMCQRNVWAHALETKLHKVAHSAASRCISACRGLVLTHSALDKQTNKQLTPETLKLSSGRYSVSSYLHVFRET